jgi:hypothetical protein
MEMQIMKFLLRAFQMMIVYVFMWQSWEDGYLPLPPILSYPHDSIELAEVKEGRNLLHGFEVVLVKSK